MIKRTIEISQQSAHLAVRYDQLQLQFHDRPADEHASIPCEDIGLVVVDHRQVTYSHAALSTLLDFGAVVVVCGKDHLPSGLLLPLSNHTEVRWRIEDQINCSKPLQKQLWKQLVEAKIHAQATCLSNCNEYEDGIRKLHNLKKTVHSGDKTNVEAQAARVYWSAWKREILPQFQRDPNGKDSLNGMLNYGYAILRAAVARSIVSAGLIPMLGLHHCNRSNNFALADDLMEPLRPLVDERVHYLFQHGLRELTPATKAGLLEILGNPVIVEDESGPLMVQIHRLVTSLVQCFSGKSRELVVPTQC